METPDLFNQPVETPQSFHNTNMESDVPTSENKAGRQEDIILEMFKKKPDSEFSPEDILDQWTKAGNRDVPLTSIRRAISNLTYRGELVKTLNQKPGMYGKQISTWTLPKF